MSIKRRPVTGKPVSEMRRRSVARLSYRGSVGTRVALKKWHQQYAHQAYQQPRIISLINCRRVRMSKSNKRKIISPRARQ